MARGEVHGFLGPNGAGKTTTLRVLLGLIRADAGSVAVLGADPWQDAPELHRRIAYVPGDVAFWPNLTGGQVLGLLARLRDDARPQRRAELLVLDEPTSGLDPLMDQVFRECVREEAASGDRTVLLSSHILAEVEALCGTVTIVRDGRTVEHGPLSDLRHLGRTSVDPRVASAPDLTGLDGVHDVTLDGDHLMLQADAAALGPVLARLSAAGLVALTCRPPTLEELFLRQYESARP